MGNVLANQIDWKRFAQAAPHAYHNLGAWRLTLLPTGGIVGDGLERAPKASVENGEKLLRQFPLWFDVGAAAWLKVLNGQVVVLRLRCTDKANYRSARSLASEFQWIGGHRR